LHGQGRRHALNEAAMRSLSAMTPNHPLWPEFLERLERADLCHRTTEHSRAILETMSGVDVQASLRALRALGGYCDCSIRYDVDEARSRLRA
jgi:hypothetical protein